MGTDPLPPLVWHTFPATPIRREYRALCVETGARPPPMVIEMKGRRCYVTSEARVRRRNQCRYSYNVVFVRFRDDGSMETFTGAFFNRMARVANALPGDPP